MENPLADYLEHILDHTRDHRSETRGERIFLTGGTGFVGAWLTESLLWANTRLNLGLSVTLLTRTAAAFGKRSPHLAGDLAVTLLEGAAVSFAYPDGSLPLIVHAATARSFPPDAARPAGIFDRDFAATRRVLEMARAKGARRMLFTSSGAVYG